MANRFDRLFQLPPNQYIEGAPVILAAGALLKDNETGSVIAQLKFQSVSEKHIKAVKVSLSAFDISKTEVQGVSDYQYLEMNISNGQEFGGNKAIVMPSPITRSFGISSIVVVFQDSSMWECKAQFAALPAVKSLSFTLNGAELEKQYRIATNERAKYTPAENKGLWQCSCGTWNSGTNCTHCRIVKSAVFSAMDLASLTAQMNIRLAAVAEQKRIATEKEAERKAAQKAKQKSIIKKAKIAVAFIVPIIVIALLFSQWLLPDVIQPAIAYSEAEKLLADGQYDAAAQAFEALGNYKDSAERVCEAYYDAAVKLYEKAQYEKAAQVFEKLGNYKDSANMLCESKYQQGIQLTDAKQYEEAYQIFFELGEHANAQLYLAAFEWVCVEERSEKDYILEFMYDKNGRLVSQRKDDYDSEVLDRTYKYSYDKNGRLYKLQEFEYDGELYITTTYTYDKYGKLIEAHEDWKYFEFLTKYTYDKNGYLVCEEQYKRDKDEGQEYAPYYIYKYTNDSAGYVLSEVHTTASGEYKYEYTYDEHGFCIEHKVTNSRGTSNYSYDYDEYGRLVALTRTSSDGSTAKTTYRYKCFFDAEKLATLTGPDKFYNDAERLLEEGKYEQAIELFESLNGYKDSKEQIEQIYDVIDEEAYTAALALLDNGSYEAAILAFEKLGNFKDSAAKVKEAQEALKPERYAEAERLLANGKTAEAAIVFGKLGDYSDSITRSLELWNEVAKRCTLAAGEFATMAIKTDGTVLVTGGSTDYNFSNWANLVSVCSGDSHYIGLKADGTVVATGYNSDNQCDVSSWKNIVSISAGSTFTVGLKADGTVVAVGSNSLGQCNVSGWTDIIAVYAGHSHTIGLKSDGTVVATGNNGDGQLNVSSWRNIVDIGIGVFHTVGLRSDGTVVAVGANSDYQCDISKWKGIVDIAAGFKHTVGLKSDGTVVTTQSFNDDIPEWKDIVAISAGNYFTVGLKSDGTVVASGRNNYGQCDISEWKKIRLPN